eukprot:COSAG04_NODE_1211_length_7719_cov_2.630232_9_plen_783_part_01
MVHATSRTPAGPFLRQEVIAPVFAHNPTLLALHDGSYALYFINEKCCYPPGKPEEMQCGLSAAKPWQCTNGSSPITDTDRFQCYNPSSVVMHSTSLWGPWSSPVKVLEPEKSSPFFGYGLDNPAAWQMANGSIRLIFRSGYGPWTFPWATKNKGRRDYVGVATSDHWAGPFTISPLPILDHMGDNCGSCLEDPHIWQSPRTGYWHGLAHGMGPFGEWGSANCGRHFFSRDGERWELSRQIAYTGTIQYASGQNVTYNRRERPHILFADGEPSWLYTAVEQNFSKGGQKDYSFTGAQKLGYKTDDASFSGADLAVAEEFTPRQLKLLRLMVAEEVDERIQPVRARADKAEAEAAALKTRVDQLEREATPGRRRRRRTQSATCDSSTLTARTDAAMDACCPSGSGGGGHRILQASCELPDTCPSAECAAVFVPYFSDCGAVLSSMPQLPLDQFRGFYGSCQDMSSGSQLMLGDAEPAMIFHVLVVDEATAQSGSMFPGSGGDLPRGHLDPLRPLSPPGPTPPPGAVAAEEFQAVCTKANLATCAPVCSALTHGYLLSIEINGRGTVMTCNKVDSLFSWQGQASLGGYIGANLVSFFSAVTSGAAGTYLGTLTQDAGIITDLIIRASQEVDISGDRSLVSAPSWGTGRLEISQFGSLTLSYLVLPGMISAAVGATKLTVSDCALRGRDGQLPRGDQVTMYLHDVTATFSRTDFGGPGPSRDGRGVSSEGGRVAIINCTNLDGRFNVYNNGSIALVGVRGLLAPSDPNSGVWIDAHTGGSISVSSMA